MFNPKSDSSAEQQLKVQRLVVRGDDKDLWDSNSPSIIVGVDLGRASNFAILGGSAITNTGNSVVTGDLGLSPGSSVTGFPPGVVVGTQHITDSAAANAQTDALAAYNLLAAHGGYTAISSTLDGQTLSPGYYSELSGTFHLASSGPGTLTLDAGGNSNAVFVFKAASTLTTGAGGIPTIVLANGAVAANVFWIVGSSATINAGTAGTFYGTILATTSITDTLGGIVNGRLIALNAAVTLSAATVINGSGSSGGSGQLLVHIREFVDKVYLVYGKVDASNTITNINHLSVSIVDSVTHLAGGNQEDILINGIGTLLTYDSVVLHYIVKN